MWEDMWSILGSAHPENVRETSRGLLVQGRLDMEDNPTAAQVHRLMKRGNLTGWSFGYEVKDSRRGKKGERGSSRRSISMRSAHASSEQTRRPSWSA